MNWSRLQWKWMLFKRRLRQRGEESPSGASGGPRRLKACRNCRALVPRSTRTCPECGTRLGWFAQTGRRGVAAGLLAQAPATACLLATMLGLFLATWAATGVAPRRMGAPGGIGFLGDINGRVLFRFGAYNSAVLAVGAYWRLLTGAFLHGSIMHILFNGAALYNLGREVESVFGWARTVILFVGAGLAGSAASVLFNSEYLVGIGASGAIFGLIGVVGVFGFRRGGAYGRAVMGMAGRWAALSLVFGFIAGADNAAHVGGLIGGVALAFLVPPERERISLSWNAAGILAAALVPAAFACVLLGG